MESKLLVYFGVLAHLVVFPLVASPQVLSFSSGASYLKDDHDWGAVSIPVEAGLRFRLLDDLDFGVSLGYDHSFENEGGITWTVLSGMIEPRFIFLRSSARRPFFAICLGVGEAIASGVPPSTAHPDRSEESFRSYLRGAAAGMEFDYSEKVYADIALFYHHHHVTREGLGIYGGAVQTYGVRIGANLRLRSQSDTNTEDREG
jgi:hypothetical protein